MLLPLAIISSGTTDIVDLTGLTGPDIGSFNLKLLLWEVNIPFPLISNIEDEFVALTEKTSDPTGLKLDKSINILIVVSPPDSWEALENVVLLFFLKPRIFRVKLDPEVCMIEKELEVILELALIFP